MRVQLPTVHARHCVLTNQLQLVSLIAYLQQVLDTSSSAEEQFHAIFLDSQRGYLDDRTVGKGNAFQMAVRTREVFAHALALDARGLIVAHNHPSGDCRPSQCDLIATRRLAEVAGALDIELLDHLIFTRDKVYSMRAGGRL